MQGAATISIIVVNPFCSVYFKSKSGRGFFLQVGYSSSFYGLKNGPRKESSCSSRVNMIESCVPLHGILYSSDASVYSDLCTTASLSRELEEISVVI